MASLKEVRGRIVSINSTQQITKAMKMVAAAKLRRAQDNIVKIRPYVQKLEEILSNISSTMETDTGSPFVTERSIQKVLIVVVTSDRGLAGAFNSNVIKAANNLINNRYSSQQALGNVHILSVGKKGLDFFNKRKFKVVDQFVNVFPTLSFEKAKQAAEYTMAAFINQEYDRVDLVYNEFRNVATQVVNTSQFLPLQKLTALTTKTSNVDYIYEPSKQEIISELIPKSLKIQFYKALLESNASEHGARMTAMDKATDNAKEILKELKLTYNRTRQAAITKEILEIVGGAEALNG